MSEREFPPDDRRARRLLERLGRYTDATSFGVAEISAVVAAHPDEFPCTAEELRRAVALHGRDHGLKLVIRSTAGFVARDVPRPLRPLLEAVRDHVRRARGPVSAERIAKRFTDGSVRLAGRILARLRARGELETVGVDRYDLADRSFPPVLVDRAADAVDRLLTMNARPVHLDLVAEKLAPILGRRSARWYASLHRRVGAARGWRRDGRLLAKGPVPRGGFSGVVRAACLPGRPFTSVLTEVRFRIAIPDSFEEKVRALYLDVLNERAGRHRGPRGEED